MDRIKKNFGFGCMRLPLQGEGVDTAEMCRMVDAFLDNGFNYFDTAHGYVKGLSESALRECLTSRYPREKFVLTDKLSTHHFNKEEEIRPLFASQLEACGVDYFDFYFMHAQSADIFAKFKRCRAYETALELKAEGKFRHFGISFHDKAEVLEQILTEYPQVEVVQIQLNYVDWDDPAVESGKCLEVCRKHGKPALVMEPCKGGNLVNLPEDARAIYDGLGVSPVSCALRFAAGQEGVMMVLSGMGNLEMMEDNIASAALWIAGDSVIFDNAAHNVIDRSAGMMLIVIFVFYMWFMINASKNPNSLQSASEGDASPTTSSTDVTSSTAGIAAAHGVKAELRMINSKIKQLEGKQWFSWLLIVGGL